MWLSIVHVQRGDIPLLLCVLEEVAGHLSAIGVLAHGIWDDELLVGPVVSDDAEAVMPYQRVVLNCGDILPQKEWENGFFLLVDKGNRHPVA